MKIDWQPLRVAFFDIIKSHNPLWSGHRFVNSNKCLSYDVYPLVTDNYSISMSLLLMHV